MFEKHPIVLWVEALRSGEYSQNRGSLRKGDRFCCLGVANDVYRRETGEGIWDAPDSLFSCGFHVGTEASGVGLHRQVVEWLGLPWPQTLGRDGEESQYMGMNDGEEKSFLEIAGAIELNHPELFEHGRLATYIG